MSFFEARRPPAGADAIEIDLQGLRIVLEGLDEELSGRLLERYAPYARPGGPEGRKDLPRGGGKGGCLAESGSRKAGPDEVRPAPASLSVRSDRLAELPLPGRSDEEPLRVLLGLEPRDYFIDPPARPETNPVLLARDGDRMRYVGYRLAGWFDVAGGRGEMLLARGRYEPDLRAIENYLRAATAWQALSRGGALVHAASAVRGGRGYIFYGPSGAGKSTLSASSTQGQILSDDLSLVLPGLRGSLDVAGSPFRGTYTGGAPVVGRFPLAAGFRLIKAGKAEVRAMPRVRPFAALTANLPFVVDSLPGCPDLFARIESIFSPLHLAYLHFRKDDSFWDAIDRAGL